MGGRRNLQRPLLKIKPNYPMFIQVEGKELRQSHDNEAQPIELCSKRIRCKMCKCRDCRNIKGRKGEKRKLQICKLCQYVASKKAERIAKLSGPSVHSTASSRILGFSLPKRISTRLASRHNSCAIEGRRNRLAGVPNTTTSIWIWLHGHKHISNVCPPIHRIEHRALLWRLISSSIPVA